MRSEEDFSREIIGACMDVHTRLGPGLLESVYEQCVCIELERRKLPFRRQITLPIRYRDAVIEGTYRLDLVVCETTIVELKAVDALAPIHTAQLMTYLRLSQYPVGLLVNFNVPSLRQGIRRITLRHKSPTSSDLP